MAAGAAFTDGWPDEPAEVKAAPVAIPDDWMGIFTRSLQFSQIKQFSVDR
jgi:hypothetical protein